MARNKPGSVEDYISEFPPATQKALKQVRGIIAGMVPGAEQKISYGIPAFHWNGYYLIYFAGFKTHVGIYPAPVREESFQKDFANYKTGRGSVQFPLDKAMPVTLIKKIVKFRMQENTKRLKAKK